MYGNDTYVTQKALDIVTSVVPNLIAFDIYAVQAMDNRVGMINYIDYSYAKTKGETNKGDVFASSINMGKSDPLYTTDNVNNEPGSVVATEATQTTYPFRLAWTPVIPNSVVIKVTDGSNVVHTFVSDGSGNLTNTVPSDDWATATMNTATGELVFVLKSGSGIAKDDKVFDYVATYRFNNEDVRSDGYDWDDTLATPGQAGFTNVPEIQLKINTIPIEAKARTLRSFWAFDAAYELQKEYGQDIEQLLATQSTGEIAHEIDNELTLDLVNFANAGAPLTWSKTLTPGISLVDHYDSFMETLTKGANRIFDATRKVKAGKSVL